MMKKTLASQSFAVLTAALMMVGTAGCSSAPVQEDRPIAAEVPASAPVEDTVSSATSSIQSSDTSSQSQAPVINETPIGSDASAPSSLGASSSGRGH